MVFLDIVTALASDVWSTSTFSLESIYGIVLRHFLPSTVLQFWLSEPPISHLHFLQPSASPELKPYVCGAQVSQRPPVTLLLQWHWPLSGSQTEPPRVTEPRSSQSQGEQPSGLLGSNEWKPGLHWSHRSPITFALHRHRPATVPSGPGIVARSQAPTTPAGSQSQGTQISWNKSVKK